MPEPLLKRIPPGELPEDMAAAWDKSTRLRGDATFFEVFGLHPELYRWYTGSFYGSLFEAGRVPRKYKELLRLRLSTLHGCRFCNQGNRADALAAGIPPEQVEAIQDIENGPFDASEKAVLRFAERMALTQENAHLDAAQHRQLAAHFDDAQILELGMLAGLLSGMARFLFAFDLVEREDSCPFRPA